MYSIKPVLSVMVALQRVNVWDDYGIIILAELRDAAV